MAIKQINVSQLKCAVLDETWRAAWIAGKDPSTFNLPESCRMPVHGSTFHALVDQFTKWLTAPENKKESLALTSSDHLWSAFWDEFVSSKVNQMMTTDNPEPVLHMVDCQRHFCEHLAKLRRQCPQFSGWSDLFVDSEYALEHVRFVFGNHDIFVSGRIDAVRRHPPDALVIVDYKLSKGSELTHDMLQLAIYAELLKRTHSNLKLCGWLEYYEPALHITELTANDLSDLFSDMVLPVLRDLAGAATLKCQPRKMPKAHQTSLPNTKDSHLETADRIVACFAHFHLKIDILDWHDAPQVIRFRAKPGPGVKVVSLANRAEDLQVALSLRKMPVIGVDDGNVCIDLPKAKPDMVAWKDVVDDQTLKNHPSRVAFPVGRDVDNQLIVADLANPNTCHVLVAGTTGSGKSEFLKSMVAALMLRNTPNTLRMTLIDPKVLTFSPLAGTAFLTGPIVIDMQEAIEKLEHAVADMDQRYQQLNDEHFDNLSERFQAGLTDIPYTVLIFDEFADLVLIGGAQKKRFEALTARLAAKGRAAGVHLVLATQRPEKAVVTGLIKANLPLRICLRVNSSTDAVIVMGESGAQHLLGKGDLLCDLGEGSIRGQGVYLSKAALANVVESAR